MKKRDYINLPQSLEDKAADKISEFIGSWICVTIHAFWFLLWFMFRLDINLLTLIVSLEAIFICIFLLMAQNRQAAKDRKRDDHEAEEVDELMAIQKTQVKILNAQSDILEVLKPKQE